VRRRNIYKYGYYIFLLLPVEFVIFLKLFIELFLFFRSLKFYNLGHFFLFFSTKYSNLKRKFFLILFFAVV